MKDKLFRKILPKVSKPGRYTGNELNMIKKDWDKSQVKMVFAFPDLYELGMSHIGSQILYGLINEKTSHLLERTYTPWTDMEDIMRKEGIPLYALESFRPLADFDVVGFSLQYEMSITNILNMLDLSNIPLWADQRGEEHPLVIAGGPVVFNPEPFADFFDVFIIGDGEEVLVEFLDIIYEHKSLNRKDLLKKLALIKGVYVPAFYKINYNSDGTIESRISLVEEAPEKIQKRVVSNLDEAYFPEKPILPFMEAVHDRAVLEVMRGCQRGCRFCHAGTVYRPVRERSIKTLEKQAQKQLANTGYEEMSLTSLSTLDYSGIDRLVKGLVADYSDEGISISLSSLRVDAFSIELANEVQKVRKSTLTLAPEAGSQRLRDSINKNVTEDQLFKAVEAAFKSGWNSLKLYFMFGLPGEVEEDLESILDLLKKVRYIGKQYSERPVQIRASLASFVPKGHTPFQWRPQASIAELEEKRNYLERKKIKNVRLSFHDSRTSFLEGLFSRGDRQLSQLIYRAWEKGCKFDSWSEHFRFDLWLEAISECEIDTDFYSSRIRSYDEILPWDFIDTGVSKEFLRLENERANEGAVTSDCRHDDCNGCGICQHFEIELDIREDYQYAP
ncbi:MAG TPA: TIGR03960 family B12-binding radical SAM protein [Syntrophomonadaceae bacterium]|nr:TIGR03960 family B12-binding radical SAM protein [Syntrophomonadaceae bacterium]